MQVSAFALLANYLLFLFPGKILISRAYSFYSKTAISIYPMRHRGRLSVSPCFDLDIDDSEPIFLHDTLAYDAA